MRQTFRHLIKLHKLRGRLAAYYKAFLGERRRRPFGNGTIQYWCDSEGKLRLHIGCGANSLSGYVNIDKYPVMGADITAQADRLRFPDNSVEEIYTSHMIEHLRPIELESALREWHRVLKPEGRLRIRCPNFELYLREWLEGDYESRWGWGIVNIFGHDNRGEGLLTRNGFTRERLDRLLSANGFETVHCEVISTRSETEGTIEYRQDGDLDYQGTKKVLPKVLYVDAFAQFEAKTNTSGIARSYRTVSLLKTFDYRSATCRFGRFLMNCLLVQTAIHFQPDLVHLGKSESIYGRTVRKIKKKTKARVIHYYGDYRPEPQSWVVDIGRYADLTLLYHKDKGLIQRHLDMGVKKVGFWWVGTDPEVFYPRESNKIYDVVFIANNSSDHNEKTGQGYAGRLQLIDAIAAQGIQLHIFGNGWECLSGKPNVHLHEFVNSEKFAGVCSAAKITLGYNTNDVYFYTSWRRPLNSMACGAFHLIRHFPGLEEVLENRKHLVWFNSIPEAVELVRYYLMYDGERKKIAEAGRKEVLRRHTWDLRIAQMLTYANEMGKDTLMTAE
ncbi:MAG: glycosyltransferase [Kiritimatiellae bacterium]|nr:glycosyltransferase [Kiritimatiellia bacterium]